MTSLFRTTLCALLLSAFAARAAGTFTVTTLTGDADSGIATDAAYTHAINFKTAANVTVNGAVFTGTGTGTNPTTNDYTTSGYAALGPAWTPTVTGSVGGMLATFLYNGNPAVLTLKNLRIGQQYETVFYNAAYGGPGIRFQTITTSDGGSVHFDQNGLPGSLLKYAFTATSSTLVFTITPDIAGNTFHHYALSNRAVGPQALLTDNFYAPSNPTTTDLSYNLAARQGGSLGSVAWVSVGNTQVGNTTGSVDAGNYLFTSASGNAALNHNFNGTDSTGGLLISFDLAPDITAAGAGNSCAINLGQAVADKNGSVSGAQTHFGVRFRGSTGTLQAYDGSTILTPTEPSWGTSGVTSQLHHFEIRLTDSTDYNPFNGAGETRIEIFADGVSRYTYTKAGGYSQNYLNFTSSSTGGVDNLVIARLNETPTAPTFTTVPQGQSLWRGDALALTLNSTATGFPAVAYQWYRDNVLISGATSSSYTIADASNGGGTYTVTATNTQGSISSSAVVDVIVPTRAQRTWESAGPSSRRTGLVISEIHYHPPTRPDLRDLEFIELYNSNPWAEDIGGYRITGDADYTFPAATMIAGKGYLVVARVPVDVQTIYGISGVLGGFIGILPNSGGTVRLRKPSGAVVLEVTYNDHAPWPVAADGTGHSLVLARPSYGEASPKAWDASASIDGSPGTADIAPSSAQDHVVINEILARSVLPQVDFIELRNDAPTAVNISGCMLSDDPAVLGKFIIPANTILAGSGVISFNETQLGFSLGSAGETIYLSNAIASRVLDCVRFSGTAANVSIGRASNRDSAFRPLASSTPGASNSAARTPDVLISEIFFAPISGDNLDQWLELYNPGAVAVNVGGWKFTDGVSFILPAGTSIAAGARLVIAKNAVRTRANNPSLNPALVVGDYIGTLGGGDRITLVRPELDGAVNVDVEVDTITYSKAGRRSRWADGGGSSLEVTDLRADRTLSTAWADSDESAKAGWTTLSTTGALDLGHTSVSGADRVQLFLMGEGEALVDDVTMTPTAGSNVVSNGGFESGITGWTTQGNQSRSSVVTGGFSGSSALQLRGTSSGDPDGNRVFSALTTTLAANTSGTLAAKARWLRGTRELLLRLRGGYLENFATLNVPTNLGTPGAANSRAVANAGPSITDVSHRPLLPLGGDPIRVFARVSDPDGVASATLRWRVETNGTFTNVAMHDDGLNDDIFSGDGVFTGTIPAQAAGTLIVFHVESSDAAGVPASTAFPPDSPTHECLVRVGDTVQGGDFSAYRLWMTAANVSTWSSREKFGNEPLDCTYIYGGTRAVYGCGAWYAGSEASTPGYNSPVGNLCGYNLALPADDLVIAEDHFTLDWPVRDTTEQREQLMFWMAEQLKLPNLYRRYIHLFVNGTRRSILYDDVQQPDQTLVNEFSSGDTNGHLYKTNNWNEGADNANSTTSGVSNILTHYDTAGQHKLARYRWNWRPRAASNSNEFTDIFTLIDAVNAASNYQAGVEAVVDTENWMRTFAFHDLCSYWDSFGNPNTKNTYLYKPAAARWIQFTWDMDVGLGVFNDPVTTALFPATADAKVDALQAWPAFRRIYWRTVHEAFATFFSSTGVTPLLQRKYDALSANGISVVSPFVASGAESLSIPAWIDARRSNIQSQLNAVAATFAVTSPASVTVTSPSVTITGNAPVNGKTLTINDDEYAVTWSTLTAWSITLVPASGSHPYVVKALDYNGAQIGTSTVTVNFTGVNAWAALRINEWMASNGGSVLDPADGQSDDWLEIYNPTAAAVSLTGWRISDSSPTQTEFVFPAGYSIAASGRLLAWADNETIQSAAPTSLHLPFKLSNSGETLTLTAPDGTVVDTVTFGAQVSNISQGRVPDGSANIVFLATPSAGTANTAAIAAPAATAARTLAGDVDITVNTTAGFTYQLQMKNDLTDASWVNLGTAVTATATSLTLNDPSTGIAKRFYRVLRTP